MPHLISRRRLMKGAASLLAAPAIIRSAKAADRELLVYSWYPKPVQSIIKDFAAETNTKVNYLGSYGGNPVWWSKLLAGEVWDVFLPSMDWMTRAALAGKLEPLDLKRIPNVKNISLVGQRAIEQELTVNGKVFALPWALTINALVCNSKYVKPAQATPNWDVMWDPAYAGKLTTKDEAIIPMLTAAARLGFETSSMDKWTAAQLDEIAANLLAQKKLVRKYWSNHEEVAEMLITEQVVAGQWTDGRGRFLASQGHPVFTAVPAQGAPAVIDTIAMLGAAPNKDQAYQFIDFVLRPEQLVKISLMQGAIVLSDQANELIPAEARPTFALDPTAKYHWRRFSTPELAQKLERVWTRVKLT